MTLAGRVKRPGRRGRLALAALCLVGLGLITGLPAQAQDGVTPAVPSAEGTATVSAPTVPATTAAEAAIGAAREAATDAAALNRSEQQQSAYYKDWLATARRAELAIDANRASNAALEQLRAELVSYRQSFMSERDKNSARIETLQAQVNALGPAPEEGTSEVPDIAALRKSLNEQLATLKVPALVAQEAYSRADGLISEIDRIIRDRQKLELLARGEPPLALSVWTAALDEFNGFLRDMRNETANSWRAARDLQRLRSNLPLILALTGLGLLLLFRGVAWAERAGETLGRLAGRGAHVGRFVVSLGRIALPQIGLFLLTRAVHASEVVGLRGTMLLNLLPVWGITLFGFMWLGEQLYSRNEKEAIIPLPAPVRAAMRRTMLLAALVLVLYRLVSEIETVQNVSVNTRAVMMLPIILVASWLLLRVRKLTLLREQDGQIMPAGLRRMASTIRALTLIVAIEAPLMAAIGYQAMAEAIIFPAIMTLAVFGVVMVLQRFVSNLYAWLSGKGDAAEETIVPALAGFALALLALPVLALVWGARPTDLTELWTRFLQGFSIGGTTISPSDFLTFAVIFGAGYAATRALQGALKGSLLPRTRLDAGGQNAVVSGVGYIGIIASALLAITLAGINLSSLAIVAGALSVGIGFGLQNIVSNFVSGIILLIERPISEGDWIEVNGQMGYVRDISVRSTRIETFDRTDLIVPNADLVSGMVTNYTRGNTVGRVIVPVGVAYGTDTRRVEGILRDIADSHPMVLANPAPNVVFQGFGADSLDFEIRAILRDVNWVLSVKSDMNHEIAKRFAEEGIEIPFAQRDIWLRNPEALRPVPPVAAGPVEAARPATPVASAAPVDPDSPDTAEGEGEEP
ncbi:DUF3772 domain-containing protein [Pseudodonghicola xiamenensis]|uniref:Mechanosensitive ion channel protein MscS n=1 Tax=Pseudodonghicola xiamenensis TaxID=337702 RepID=A0A8J3H786_9RHOB|nr:DUF3772 domain-containing protein [Pseudodonghicola xiamenensis]GHG95483.1 mechanosensitive ion channel protein MscS [Pseudodonghicola xiamenensis]